VTYCTVLVKLRRSKIAASGKIRSWVLLTSMCYKITRLYCSRRAPLACTRSGDEVGLFRKL